jgi:hypothetical protein
MSLSGLLEALRGKSMEYLNKEEALQAMREGKKVSHCSFTKKRMDTGMAEVCFCLYV